MESRLEGRVCVVTGPTSGIGKETVRGLARLGARVVLACRDVAKGAAVREEIRQDTGNTNLDVRLVDLADPASIRSFASDFLATEPRLDVLVNNAGVLSFRRAVAPSGLETHFAVNVLAPFLLTESLLPLLVASAPARVVNVGSATHHSGHVDFDNLQGEREYHFLRAYSDSKLAVLLLTYEFARRFGGNGVTVNCVHPGGIRTDLYNGLPRAFRFVKFFMRSPSYGAEPVIRLAAASELREVTGRYFDRLQESRSSPGSYDTTAAARLWSVCEGLAGPAR